jgi:hypothetical protein
MEALQPDQSLVHVSASNSGRHVASVRTGRWVLPVFCAVAFSGILPSQGVGISWDEVLSLVVATGCSCLLIGKCPGVLRSPAVVWGLVSVLGAVGMLTHEEVGFVFGRCVRVFLFVLGIATAAAVPKSRQTAAAMCLGLAGVVGGVLLVYLDLKGWNSEVGWGGAEEWEIGKRGLLTSLCPFWPVAVPMAIVSVRRWRIGPSLMAIAIIPCALVATAGIGQGRGQTMILVTGAALMLLANKSILGFCGLLIGGVLIQLLGLEGGISDLFAGFLGRIGQTDILEIDRLEQAASGLRLLGDATLPELVLGLPSDRTNAGIAVGGIHNGYLDVVVTGGVVAALPMWIMLGYLVTLVWRNRSKSLDCAVASRVVIVELLMTMVAAPIFWGWQGAMYFGLAIGFACSPEVNARSSSILAG